MSESRSFALPQVWTSALAVLLGALFARSLDRPETPPRPQAEERPSVGSTVDSLLTHDPLDPFQREPIKIGSEQDPDGWAALLDALEGGTGRTLVLISLVRGGPWPEDRDRRTATRFAVVMGLTQAGFTAAHARELGLWRTEHEIDATYDLFQGPEPRASETAERPYGRAMVLWFDELRLSEPVRDLARVRCELRQSSAPLDIKIVGPTTSGSLDRWIEDSHEWKLAQPLELYSPYATVQGERLSHGGVPAASLQLTRTIGFDDKLAHLLLLELRERIPALMSLGQSVDLCSGSGQAREEGRLEPFQAWGGAPRRIAEALAGIQFIPRRAEPVRVALIVESDSLYGRTWIKNLSQAKADLARSNARFGKLRFETYPYITVVDGVGLDRAGEDSPSNPAASQLDHIARIGDTLARGGPVDAIGILGTDTYDVLQILGMLRSRFPAAVFFTTDMDAKFVAPEHRAYARNLVVGSHLGLEEELPEQSREPTEEGEQARVGALTFRDAYRHSVYRTVKSLASTGGASNLEQSPHLFEIGDGKAIDLGLAGMTLDELEPGDGEPTPPGHMSPHGPLSRFAQGLPWLGPGWARTLLVIAVGAMFAYWAFRWKSLRRLKRVAIPVAGVAGSILIASTNLSAAGSGSVAAPGFFLPFAALLACALIFRARTVLVGSLLVLLLLTRAQRAELDWSELHKFLTLAFVLALLVLVVRRADKAQPAQGLVRLTRAWKGLLVGAVLVLGSLRAVVELTDAPAKIAGEPTELFVGVSVWPTVLLRVLGILVCWVGIRQIRAQQSAHHRRIATQLGMDGTVQERSRPMVWGWLFHLPTKDGREELELAVAWSSIGQALRKRWWLAGRLFSYVLVYIGAMIPMFRANPVPAPVRGELAYLVERTSIFVLVVSFLALFLYVLESSYLALRIAARVLDESSTRLPELRTHGVPRHLAQRHTRLELTEQITRLCDRMVLWPFAVTALMILSRASLFDRWTWPPALVFTFLLFLTLLVLCTWNARRLAEGARARMLAQVDGRLAQVAGSVGRTEALTRVRRSVESMHTGAFAPLTRLPVLRSLAYPAAAVVLSSLVERGWIRF